MDTHDLGPAFVHPVRLSRDAPVIHRALTAEYEDPGRYSNSVVIKTPFRREGKWLGIRWPWLSVQAKLPAGPVTNGVWGVVVGWWRAPQDDGGWSTLLRATQLGHKPDGGDERNFEDPTSESMRGTLIDVTRRRVDFPLDDGPDE